MSPMGATTGRLMLFATGTLAATLMAACGTSGQPAATTTTTAAASENSTAAAVPSGSQSDAVGTGASEANTVSTATPACHTADLSLTVGAALPGPSASQHILMLDYTNKSAHNCYLDGYGGVDMIGPPITDLGGTYQVRRASTRAPQRLVLAPGASAHTELTYQAFENGDVGSDNSGPWTPTQLEVTPPNETTHFTLSWTPTTPIIRDDTATSPGSYISPVLPGK